MKKSGSDFSRLIAELRTDIQLLKELIHKYNLINNKIAGIKPDEFDWAALGYSIQNIYNLLENYFLRIAKFFENSIDPAQWHKDLIHRMTLDIEEVRPALFGRELEVKIDELRAFRHIFRNIYQSELDVAKLQLLNKRIPSITSEFQKAHKIFADKLKKIATHLEK